MLNVLNPNELLAEESLLTSTFTYGALGVARGLDPSCSSDNLAPGAKVGVPLWLVPDLHRRGMITFELPEVYRERWQRKMNAGAECVSLRNRSPYFYEVGAKSNAMLKDTELSAYLSKTFRSRYMGLISKGLNTMTGEEVLELCCKLSAEEQQLFDGGRSSIVTTERWMQADYRDQALKRRATAKRPAAAAPTAQELAKQQRP